jgi:uncharacterized protein YbjQ (UPF0145 family)
MEQYGAEWGSQKQQGTHMDLRRHTGIPAANITVSFALPAQHIVKNLGVVRGVTVRSRSIVGNFFGALQSLFGGNIIIYTQLCEQARKEAYQFMIMEAEQLGANAIIGLRYDATEVMAGLTEVLCYGSAVVIEPHSAAHPQS